MLDIGGNADALDGRAPRHALRMKPVEEFDGRARIGAAGVRIANVGGEEFKEALGGAFASGGDQRGGGGGEGDKLVHLAAFWIARLQISSMSLTILSRRFVIRSRGLIQIVSSHSLIFSELEPPC